VGRGREGGREGGRREGEEKTYLLAEDRGDEPRHFIQGQPHFLQRWHVSRTHALFERHGQDAGLGLLPDDGGDLGREGGREGGRVGTYHDISPVLLEKGVGPLGVRS